MMQQQLHQEPKQPNNGGLKRMQTKKHAPPDLQPKEDIPEAPSASKGVLEPAPTEKPQQEALKKLVIPKVNIEDLTGQPK